MIYSSKLQQMIMDVYHNADGLSLLTSLNAGRHYATRDRLEQLLDQSFMYNYKVVKNLKTRTIKPEYKKERLKRRDVYSQFMMEYTNYLDKNDKSNRC